MTERANLDVCKNLSSRTPSSLTVLLLPPALLCNLDVLTMFLLVLEDQIMYRMPAMCMSLFMRVTGRRIDYCRHERLHVWIRATVGNQRNDLMKTQIRLKKAHCLQFECTLLPHTLKSMRRQRYVPAADAQ